MKKVMIIVLAITMIFLVFIMLLGCDEDREGEARVPDSSKNFEGSDYQDVIKQLETAGFVNISTEILDNLITGWLTKEGSVNKVSINGVTNFNSGTWFPIPNGF